MMTRQQYIDKNKQLAVNATAGTGLFPSVLMAQAIVESNNGNSELARVYHNHFGIKADSSWKGKKVNFKTREVFDGKDVVIGDFFRVYSSDAEGFKDRTKFLKSNPRYTKAGVFSAKTPEAQIEALKKAGYATDPLYVTLLTSILNKYKLSVIDTLKKKDLL